MRSSCGGLQRQKTSWKLPASEAVQPQFDGASDSVLRLPGASTRRSVRYNDSVSSQIFY